MPDGDAFDSAYGRLDFTTLKAGPGATRDEPEAAPAAARDTPRSRLLPRLALLAPVRKTRRRRAPPQPR